MYIKALNQLFRGLSPESPSLHFQFALINAQDIDVQFALKLLPWQQGLLIAVFL